MEPYRGRVDKIVEMLLDKNGQAQAANKRFYDALERRRKLVHEVCRTPHKYSEKDETIEGMVKINQLVDDICNTVLFIFNFLMIIGNIYIQQGRI